MSQLTRRRRWGVLAICCLALLMVGLDNTIVNVALPAMGRELRTRVSGLEWVVDAYTIVLAALLMLSGSLADRFGRKRVFQVGLAVFSVGSLLCGLAASSGLLVGFRALQAVGGSMLNPVAVSIIANTFTDRGERARAMGVWAAVFGLGIALGPLAGGALVTGLGWRWIFFVNVPIGAAAVALVARFVPESRAEHPRRVDILGQLLVIVLFATLTFGVIEGPATGWTSARIVTAFIVAAAASVVLLWWEPRRREPLIELGLFRSAPLTSAVVIAVCAYISLGALLFVNTLYLQQQRGLTALQAGVRTLPMAALVMLGAVVSGRLIAARGAREPLLVGGIGILAAALILTTLSASTPYLVLSAAYVLFGAGFGLLNAPITNTAVSGLPSAQAGLAGGIASTSRQLGQSMGVAIGGAFTAATAGSAAHANANLAAHSHPVWWVVAGCGAAITVIGLLAAGHSTTSGHPVAGGRETRPQ